jgi:hypothetical protein
VADKNHIKEAARKRKLLINFLKNKKEIDFKKLQAFIMKTWSQDSVKASSTLNKLKTDYPEIFTGKKIVKSKLSELGEDVVSVFAKNNKTELIENAKLRYEADPKALTNEALAAKKKVPVTTVEKANRLVVPDKYKLTGIPPSVLEKRSNDLYQDTIDRMAIGNPNKYQGKKYSDLDNSAQQSVRVSQGNYKKGADRFTSSTITIDGKKQTFNIKGLNQKIADQITDGIKGIKKWEKNSTIDNWFKIFSTKAAAEGGKRAFGLNIRNYLKGKEDNPDLKRIFDELNIKKVIGTPVANNITKTISDENVSKWKASRGSEASAKGYKATEDYEEIIKIFNNYDPPPGLTRDQIRGDLLKLLKASAVIKQRFKNKKEPLTGKALLTRLTNAQAGILAKEFGDGKNRYEFATKFTRPELQKFLNKGQKYFPNEMNRTLTSTIGKYLKGDDLKLAQQKYRAFKSLAKAISEELGKGGTRGDAFLQMDHPISLKVLEDTKNFAGALRVNPIAGDVNKVKGQIERRLANAVRKKDANKIKNLNLITRGLFGEAAGDYEFVDNKFKVKSFGADEFLKADLLKDLNKNINLRDEILKNFDSIDDDIFSQAGIKNVGTFRNQFLNKTESIDPVKFKQSVLTWTKQNPDLTRLIKGRIGCLRKAAADGGRINMQEGGDPSDACFNSKLNKNPGLIARAFQTLPKVARVGVVGMGLAAGAGIALSGLRFNPEKGEIVNTRTDQKADQNQILEYVKDNPLKVTAGTSIGFAAQEVPGAYKAARDLGRGRVRSTLGISGAIRPLLTTFGTPLITGLYEGAIGAKRLEEGETMTDVLTDPLGPALGVSLMEPLSKLSGVVKDAPKRTMLEGAKNYFNLSNVGQARPGLTGQILRMGLSPRMIAGASRFLGLPGIALGLGMSGYDAYKNYQNQEGMIYNLFNRDE